MKKLSQFNKIVEKNGSFIYLNTYTGFCVGLKPKEHEVVEENYKNLAEFEINYPTIFNKFYESGFIIDDTRNEKEEILFNKKKAVFLDREYRLFLHPTLDCNFNCWYCYEEHPKDVMSEETIDKVKKHLELMSNNITGLHLSWFGGEPLMYYKEIVEPMSKFAKELMLRKGLTFRNSITTNGYYITKEMIESFKGIELFTFQITLDGSKEKHDKVRKHFGEPSFDKITENIIHLCTDIKQANIVLRLNYDDKTLDYGPDFITIFPKEIRGNIRIDYQRVWQTIPREECNNKVMLEENEKLIKWMNFAHMEGFWVNFTKLRLNCDVSCYVDRYYHLEIDPFGKVFKCTAKGYSDENVVGTLLDNGDIAFRSDKMAKRFHRLYVENAKCYDCIYLPLCSGICTENAILSDWAEDCVLKYSEVPIDDAIINQFYYNVKRMMSND